MRIKVDIEVEVLGLGCAIAMDLPDTADSETVAAASMRLANRIQIEMRRIAQEMFPTFAVE